MDDVVPCPACQTVAAPVIAPGTWDELMHNWHRHGLLHQVKPIASALYGQWCDARGLTPTSWPPVEKEA